MYERQSRDLVISDSVDEDVEIRTYKKPCDKAHLDCKTYLAE
jgi:hypothetical protein